MSRTKTRMPSSSPFQLGLLIAILTVTSVSATAQCSKPGLVPWKISVNPPIVAANVLDLNGDGKPDLVGKEEPGKTKIALGLGNGDFAAPATYVTGSFAEQPVFGDVNGDGKPDMAVYSQGNPSVDIWMNDGSGSFSFTTSFANSGAPSSIADFNGDGKGDLFSVGGLATSSGFFSIRLGNGAGLFSAAISYGGSIGVRDLNRALVGDFNGDNRPDVAGVFVLHSGQSDAAVSLRLFMNDGSSVLTGGTATDLGSAELRTAADVNGDGKADLFGVKVSASKFTALMNNGSAVFTPQDYSVRVQPSAIRAMDFNGDGLLDLVLTYGFIQGPQGTTIMTGNGMGGFTRADLTKLEMFGPAADLDGDNKPEYLRGGRSPWALDTVTYFYHTTCAASGDPRRIDFDGNGLTEATIFRPSNGTWYVKTTGFGGTLVTTQFGVSGDMPMAGDYDGDGRSDIAVFRPSSGDWFILRSSDQSFAGVHFGAAGDKAIPGDYDGDGTSDIAVYRPSNGGWYYLHSSDGSFHAVGFGISSDSPVPADLDGDGKVDITVFRPSEGAWYSLSSSTGAFSGRNWGSSGDIAVAADYDGDGKDDIAVWRPSNGSWFALRSYNGAMLALPWGTAGDIPVIGYAGGSNSGQSPPYAIPAIYRPGTGIFYAAFSGFEGTPVGSGSDIPAASVYPVQ
jgi:hypothetical protein